MDFKYNQSKQQWELKDGSKVIIIIENPSQEEINYWTLHTTKTKVPISGSSNQNNRPKLA